MYKREITFKDNENNLTEIKIEIKEGRLSICGEHSGSSGQCNDSIIPKNKYQGKLLVIWHKWHLNDMNACSVDMKAAGWDNLAIKDIYKQYDKFTELIRQVPEYIEVFICPGQHDAVRRADVLFI